MWHSSAFVGGFCRLNHLADAPSLSAKALEMFDEAFARCTLASTGIDTFHAARQLIRGGLGSAAFIASLSSSGSASDPPSV